MPLDATNYSPKPRDPILRTLLRARELLERGWCQHQLSLDAKGRPCNALGETAASYCLAGATYRAAADVAGGMGTYNGACLWLSDAFDGDCSVGAFNDYYGRTKAEVLAVVDKAIESRRAHLGARVEVAHA